MWVLGYYLAGAAVFGYRISLVRDLVARRSNPKVKWLREAQAVRWGRSPADPPLFAARVLAGRRSPFVTGLPGAILGACA